MSSVTIDQNRFKRKMRALAEGSPHVAANALNYLAFNTREEMQRQMRSIFHAPTPFTQRGILVDKATPNHLEARVFLRDDASKGTPPAKYLQSQIHGGARALKRFERALRANYILPAGMFAVPSKYAPLDRYGNFPKGELTRLISQVRGFGEQGYKANATEQSMARRWKGTKNRRGSKYFVIPRQTGKLPPGIYLRKNYGNDSRLDHLSHGGAKPIFIFVSSPPSYSARFPFRQIAARVAREQLQTVFRRAVVRELVGRVNRTA